MSRSRPLETHLLQRGHTFYYRARIPGSAFVRSPRSPHIVVSLKTRDLDRAARRARLMRVAMDRAIDEGRSLTSDEVRARTRYHYEEMRRTIDDLDLVARRFGRGPDTERRTNEVHGWANVLLARFGRARDLRFDETCPGKAHLHENDVDDALIPEIAKQHAELVRTEIGGLLTEARKLHCDEGNYAWWVEECGFQLRTAFNYRRLFECYAEHVERVAHVNQTELLALTKPVAKELRAEFLSANEPWSTKEIRERLRGLAKDKRPTTPSFENATATDLANALRRRLGRYFDPFAKRVRDLPPDELQSAIITLLDKEQSGEEQIA